MVNCHTTQNDPSGQDTTTKGSQKGDNLDKQEDTTLTSDYLDNEDDLGSQDDAGANNNQETTEVIDTTIGRASSEGTTLGQELDEGQDL